MQSVLVPPLSILLERAQPLFLLTKPFVLEGRHCRQRRRFVSFLIIYQPEPLWLLKQRNVLSRQLTHLNNKLGFVKIYLPYSDNVLFFNGKHVILHNNVPTCNVFVSVIFVITKFRASSLCLEIKALEMRMHQSDRFQAAGSYTFFRFQNAAKGWYGRLRQMIKCYFQKLKSLYFLPRQARIDFHFRLSQHMAS